MGSGEVECDHRQAARHGLEGDVTEGLGLAGEQEQVTAGVVAGQFLAFLRTSEDCIRWASRSDCSAGPLPTRMKRASGRADLIALNARNAVSRFFSGARRPTYITAMSSGLSPHVVRSASSLRCGENSSVCTPRGQTRSLANPASASSPASTLVGTSVPAARLWKRRR